MEKRRYKKIVLLLFFLAAPLLVFLAGFSIAKSTIGSENVMLTIWTAGTPNGISNVTYGTIRGKTPNDYNFYFYANYTNSSSYTAINSTNGNGSCTIRFNDTFGDYSNYVLLVFNSSTWLYGYNRSFNFKGNLSFQVNCTSDYGNLTISDIFTVRNTVPWINKSEITATMNAVTCYEDDIASCTYNLSANPFLVEDDYNDISTLSFEVIYANTTLTNYSLSARGMLIVNKTQVSANQTQELRYTVIDSSGGPDSATLPVIIVSMNDAPKFNGLINSTFNISELFFMNVNITDEENDIPFNLNITFLSCSTAKWSYRNSTDCELFNNTQYAFNENSGLLSISFTPEKNDVGDYIINFTVGDVYNATSIQIINFSVRNINSYPYFTYVCDNERNAKENEGFICYINATDLDETNNLTFSSNESHFFVSEVVAVNASTDYSGFVIVNTTFSDSFVGNRTINISVMDTGPPIRINFTIISFFVENMNDSVFIYMPASKTVYTTGNYTINVNATDDDLLIPDKTVYDERIYFHSNNSAVSLVSNTTLLNKSIAYFTIYSNQLGVGVHYVNISARDSNNYSCASGIIEITVLGNTAPIWQNTMLLNHSLIEDIPFYLNLSMNVSDAEGSSLTFSFSNDTSFPSFNLNYTTGIINFTPRDADVGQHIVIISASDGIVNSSVSFKFNVTNIPDSPVFEVIPPINSYIGTSNGNASVNTNSDVVTMEDNVTSLYVWIADDDLKIPLSQRSFYNESFVLNLTIEGPHTSLLNFTKSNSFPTANIPNRTQYDATFKPNKTSVGSYNITLNITDASGIKISLRFNLTVQETEHSPVVISPGNMSYSYNETVYLDFNATDIEDINETFVGGNLTYKIANLTAGGDFLTIGPKNGIINFTLNKSLVGVWEFNVSVNDSSGRVGSSIFRISVYGYPVISSPLKGTKFSFIENATAVINFTVNDAVESIQNGLLNYYVYVGSNLLNFSRGNGNGTVFPVFVTPTYTDETHGETINLTLYVENQKLSNSTSWSVIVNHSNYPLTQSANIGGINSKVSGTSPVTLNLTEYFSDYDAIDIYYNQTIGFKEFMINSSGEIIVTIANWTNGTEPSITFSSVSNAIGNYSLVAYEYNITNSSHLLRNITSNYFIVELSTVTTPSSTVGGGGGGVKKSVSVPEPLNIVVPKMIRPRENVIIPVSIINNGTIALSKIKLTSEIRKNEVLLSHINSFFDKNYIDILEPGKSLNVTLSIELNTSNEEGVFEVSIFAESQDPIYKDSAIVVLDLEEHSTIKEKIFFTEEFIVGNPQCRELLEVVKEAKKAYENNLYELASMKANEALEACKRAISQPPLLKFSEPFTNYLGKYLGITSVLLMILFLLYSLYRRIALRRAIKENI